MDVLSWAQGADIGERVTYHHRRCEDTPLHLLRARASPPRKEPDETLGHLAMYTAYEAHLKGLVFLAQRRGNGWWMYEATRISRPAAVVLGLLPKSLVA